MGFFKNLFRRGKKDKSGKKSSKGATFSNSKSTDRDGSPDSEQQDDNNGKAAPGPDLSVGGQRLVLSPRNQSVPHMDEEPPYSHRGAGPVDLDEDSLADGENAVRRVDLDTLTPHKPVFSLPPEESKIRFSAGQMYADDNSHSDGESSSFNLSTDAEDTDYENLRRRGVVPPTLLDTSTLSAASNTPTNASMYHTDEGTIFPDLLTDDDATRASSGQPRQQQQNMSVLSTSPSQDSAEETWDQKEGSSAQPKPKSVAENYPYSASATAAKPIASPSHGYQGHAKSTPGSLAFPASPPRAPSGLAPTPSSSSSGYGPRSDFASPRSNGLAPSSSSSGHGGPRSDFASPKSKSSSPPAVAGFDDGFANFADFNNVSFPSDPIWSTHRSIKSTGSAGPTMTTAAASPPVPQSRYTETSLSELLAQAKSKSSSGRIRRSGGSVNSAPALSASYMRQHHNLKPVGSTSPRQNLEAPPGASVSDIIRNLEAANVTRTGESGSVTSGQQEHKRTSSRGDDMSTHSRDNISVRSAKERLRRRREGKLRSGGHSSDSEENEATENWLVDEVTGALGPRGIAADLESLSGRSNRSRSSGGGRSHKSHRSHRSHRSSSRRQGKSSGGESISSHGSRRSRYSHRSTRSHLSQMSEQSRSVANDLLRLEMQLAMVGSGENAELAAKRSSSGGNASVGGSSRRSAARTVSSKRSSTSARRTRITVLAPPGKLGIILANKADGKGTMVSGVRTSSIMAEKISPGDRIVAIDGEDVSLMTVSEITTIMARKSEFERTLTVLTTPRTSNEEPGSPRAGDYDYRYRTHRG